MPKYNIAVSVDSKGVVTGARVGGQAMEDMGRRSQIAGKMMNLAKVAAAGMAVAVGATMVKALKDGIAGMIVQERTLAQLEARIQATGGVAGFTTQQLHGMAEAMQNATGVANELVESGQNVLLTFTRIRGEAFERTMQAAMDVAEVTQQQLIPTIQMLGKALNDPVSQLGQLSRSGIQFTDDQKALIKELAETNRLAEAQGIILDELETQYGGASVAARDTLGGALQALREEWLDLTKAMAQSTGAGSPMRVGVEAIIKVIQLMNKHMLAAVAAVQMWALGTVRAVQMAADAWALYKRILAEVFPWGKKSAASAQHLADQLDGVADAIDDALDDTLTRYAAQLLGIDTAQKGVAASAGSVSEEIDHVAESLKRINAEIEDHKAKIEEIEAAHKLAMEAIRDHAEAVERLDEALGSELGGAAAIEIPFFLSEDSIAAAFDEMEAWITEYVMESGTILLESLKGQRQQAAMRVLGDSLKVVVANAFADAIESGDVQQALQGLGQALFTIAGAVVGGYFGGPAGAQAGATVGNAIGGLFAGDPNKAARAQAEQDRIARELLQAFDRLSKFLDRSLGGSLLGTIKTFRDVHQAIDDAFHAHGRYVETLEAVSLVLKDARDAILGITDEGFGDRLRAAQRFNEELDKMAEEMELLARAVVGIPGGELGVGQGGLPTEEDFNRINERLGLEIDYEQFMEDVAAGVQAALDLLPEMIDLSGLAEQLALEFMGIDFSFLSIIETADRLRESIKDLNLSRKETRRLLKLVAEAERIRLDQLKVDALGDLVNMMLRFGVFEGQAREKQAELMRRQALLDLALIEGQLNALKIMDAVLQGWVDELRDVINNHDFLADLNIGSVGGGIGGRGRGRGRRQKRADFMDRLMGMLGRGAADLNREFRDLLGNLADMYAEAKRLKLPLGEVQAVMRQIVREFGQQAFQGVSDFLTELRGPGGAAGGTLAEQFASAQRAFADTMRRAQGGDLNAVQSLPGAAQALLDLGQQMFGSTAQFNALVAMVESSLTSVLGQQNAILDRAAGQHQATLDAIGFQTETLATIQTEGNAVLERQERKLGKIERRLHTQNGILEQIAAAL